MKSEASMAEPIERSPFPKDESEFKADPRISYSKEKDVYILEDEQDNEWMWLSKHSKWGPVVDDALAERQAQIYKMDGVDENEPVADPKKRKAAANEDTATKRQRQADNGPVDARNSAVYVTNLPKDTEEQELESTFSKYGMIAESIDSNQKRIKMYYDDNGDFKGDALIVYFRAESIPLAIQMLDGTDFRLGQPAAGGRMRVRVAERSFKKDQDQASRRQPVAKGSHAYQDREKAKKKKEEMTKLLADWDDDDPQRLQEPDRFDKFVVIKKVFTLAELEEDADAATEIKGEVREEAEKFGEVTSVKLYDGEPTGVVVVRFNDAKEAQRCCENFDGRNFGLRQLLAYTSNGKERFRMAKKKHEDEDEEVRLAKFSKDLAEGKA